ncbi:hypothetical protein [Corynebacterium sp.]|uniref:hypothetical protein n=1 Tax=Corynebacterium sp. TaxID=1720 RepID=UPI0025C1E1AC|nr:hypothetical protein [Corynebacterium sp.]
MSPRVSGHRPGITRAVLAGVVATTLGLAACGSDDADGDSATSTTASSSAAATSEKTSTGASESSEASESAAPDADESAEPAPDERPEGDGEGDRPADAPPPAPANAPAGNAANGDDAAQITALEKGFGEDRSYSDYLRYTYEHTCNADLDQAGGRDALMQDAGANGDLAQKPTSEVMGTLPVIHGVNDIRVNGDRATANLDQTMNGNRQTLPKNYVRENGQWRTCIA